MSRYLALIPAGGSGARMGAGLPKQYRLLAGRPLIVHTLQALLDFTPVECVHVVVAPDDALARRYLSGLSARVRLHFCGGSTRADSVRNGLAAMAAADADWVLVHDAARPCIRPEALQRLIDEVSDDAVGGLLAVPVADTLKRAAADGRVTRTEPREGLWQAQTPQMFRYRLLCEALAAPWPSAPTDEAQAVEWAGHAPRLVLGDPRNLKVTWPADLALAEQWLGESR